MEEDGSVKVTVTRLRRRLSVEQSEDGNSSPAPSTPTKKRGGRLAAKPQLELINENTPVSSPRNTRRKSLATEAEEKSITPSRRSARIKSNTSIVSDTQSVQATNSPRAKRAARRHSQAGSDNEGPATPARQTRRTRKDSASSVENQESGTLNKPLPVAEMVIEEEPESEVQKTADKSKASPTTASEELSPNSARKSKRLLDKRNRRSGSHKMDQDTSSNKSLNISTTNEKASSETESISRSPLNKSVKSKEPKNNLSESNMSLLTKLDTETKVNKSNHNKSASASFNTEQNDKSKRNRTESWPTITASGGKDSINLSDNELSGKKKNKSNKLDVINHSPKMNETNTSINAQNSSQSFVDSSSKRKKRQSETLLTKEAEQKNEDLQTTEALASKGSGISTKEISNVQSDNTNITSDVAMLFETAPNNVQATVYFEDSDSNSVSAITTDKDGHLDSEDQCVPVVKHDFKGSLSPEKSTIVSNAELGFSSEINKDNTSNNIPKDVMDDVDNSCEPMDVDETYHDEILQKSRETLNLSKSECKSLSITQETNKSKRKSSITDTSGLSKTTEEETNKSKRKSSISNADTDSADLSKSTVEETNKSQRKSTISNQVADDLDQSETTEEETNKSKRKSSISNSAADTSGLHKTTEEETNKSKSRLSISNAADTSGLHKTTEEETNKSNSKLSISNAADTSDLSKTTVEETNKSKRNSSISKSAADDLEQSKTTEEETNKSKRKSSASNAGDASDRSRDDNKSTLILSQIKDVSSTSETINSPKPTLNEVLSKSEINVNSIVNKKVSKGNLSLNDVKGTPKNKNIQKLTMQTSTPIIMEQPDIKTKGNTQNNSTEKNKGNFSKSVNDSDSSEEESDDDEYSLEKSKLLNDEAEEASDDYESGDSRDEEERRYEEVHEIVERGETLTSDDDISNDTDYEKDSFIVSSDAEDNELLSGSGDDLAMSDNELTMSNKSKKKYNERKLKEQKNASREMFESRHKLNTSDQNSPTPKIKKNRMRIDSSLLASDEEEVVKPKKSNRMRLDSTFDTDVKEEETNTSLNKSRKKNKTLQDDTLDTAVEQEVSKNVSLKKGNKNKSMQDSICNKSAVDEKEITIFNESTADHADPLQVHFKQEPKTPQKDLNMSIVQFTDRQEIENVQITESNSILNQTGTDPLQATMACEDSDSSESEEIMQNYDAVLNDLNKGKKTKLNNNNISLNMDQKSKKNRVEPIIDQLNLTHTKKPKKNKNRSEDVVDSKSVETSTKTPESDNESSNSIDLQLLFSEDNVSDEEQENKADDDCIPLKKTPGKTNLRESIGMKTSQQDSTLNDSSKKKQKRKSAIAPVASNEEQELINADDNELNKSKSKKNNQKTSSAVEAAAETLDISSSSLNKSGLKKKKHSILEPEVEESQDMLNKSKDVSLNESGRKKKNKLSISEPAVEETQDMCNKSKEMNVSLNESGLKKKKKLPISEPAVEESHGANNAEPVLNESIKKKKKRKSSLNAQETEQPEGDLFFIDTKGTLQDNKDGELNEPSQNVSSGGKKKKKKNKSNVLRNENKEKISDKTIEETNMARTPQSEKKKEKKISHKVETLVDDDSDGAPDETPYLSVKATEEDLQNTETVIESAEAGSGKKKKKKKKKSAARNQSGQSIDTVVDIASNSKKRKRKSSNAESSQGDGQESVETVPVNEVAGSQKKKRKTSHNDDNNSSEPVETHVKKNKKRKNRDEGGDNKRAKVSKDSSFQEVYVPRLPDDLLTQLDDKPRKRDTAKVVSTSNFIVETARQKRAKPSNYLEESIYLDAASPVARKGKSRIKKPKVLPFIPTASISDRGFTTNFKINKLSQATEFAAEPFGFSKESYLQKKSIKRLGTYELYKKQILQKLSKF